MEFTTAMNGILALFAKPIVLVRELILKSSFGDFILIGLAFALTYYLVNKKIILVSGAGYAVITFLIYALIKFAGAGI